MSQEGTVTRGPALRRWLLVGALLLVGGVLFFWFAPESQPPAPVTVHESP